MDKLMVVLKHASLLYNYKDELRQNCPNELELCWRSSNGNIIKNFNIKGHTYTTNFSTYEHVKTLSISSPEMYLFIKFETEFGAHTIKNPFITISDDFYGFDKFCNFDFYYFLKFISGNDSTYTDVQDYKKYYINPTDDDKFNMNLSLHEKIIDQIEFNLRLKDAGIDNILMLECQIPFDEIYTQLPLVIDSLSEHIRYKITGV